MSVLHNYRYSHPSRLANIAGVRYALKLALGAEGLHLRKSS